MKGQATIEFLASIFLFLLALLTALTLLSGSLPDFQEDLQQSSKNMELYTVTEKVLSTPGYHSNGSGGTDWEENINYTEEFGLASDHLVVERDKLEAIRTAGDDRFNYSQFRRLHDLDNQYYFTFIWYPVVETSQTFTRTEPPSFIREPNQNLYFSAENRVHYGTFNIDGSEYRFLVTAHDGVYDVVRISDDWDFRARQPLNEGGTWIRGEFNFTVTSIQNRERRPGTSVILEHDLKSFGANPEDTEGSRTKLNRYAVLQGSGTDPEPLRVEVLAW